jgi:hypothetical protein
METTIVEDKFDKFARDFYRFLAVRYPALRPEYKIKVATGTWKAAIPTKLLPDTKTEPFRHPFVVFDWSNANGIEDRGRILTCLGFTEEQARMFSEYDAIIFVDYNKPVRMENGDTYLWHILIAHHIMHIAEALTDQQLINEPPDRHDYEEREALQHLHRFVNWIGGVDETINRYVPCRE